MALTACLIIIGKTKRSPRSKGQRTHHVRSLETRAVIRLVQYLTIYFLFFILILLISIISNLFQALSFSFLLQDGRLLPQGNFSDGSPLVNFITSRMFFIIDFIFLFNSTHISLISRVLDL